MGGMAGMAGVGATGGDVGVDAGVPAELAELARGYGVATDFWDWQRRHRPVSAATLRAVLGALGVDATTPEAVRGALTARWQDGWRRVLPACVVVPAGEPRQVPVRLPDGFAAQVVLELEDGGRRPVDVRYAGGERVELDGVLRVELRADLPADLPVGYHRLTAATPTGPAHALLVCHPARLPDPGTLAGPAGRLWGFAVQLYSVRSRASWGIGDVGDLRDLAAWSAADLGAGFVVTSPLDAAAPVAPIEPSPYLPTSRRFGDPIYLRVADVPEYAALDAAGRRRVDELGAAVRAAVRSPDLLDRDAVWAAKRAALRLLHAAPPAADRVAGFAAFRAGEGAALADFATWCAIAERYGAAQCDWPPGLDHPAASGVAAFRAAHADDVDFYAWLQWQLADQLGAAQRAARAAGMPVGIVHDLPVGVHPGGADAWALADVLAGEMSVGAPPDEFNQQGQDWSQPPLHPLRLAETGYAAFRELVRGALRAGGGLRVDHVMGLFRLWWIPAGMPPTAGAYVSYDHEAMVGILLLEAARAGENAVVVGEDLGTVEPWVRELLAGRGILGTSVLWFERGDDGWPRPPEHWRRLCLAAVTVHDLPPTAGYLDGVHVRLRDRLGVLTRPAAQEWAEFAADRARWFRVLHAAGLLAGDDGSGGDAGSHVDVDAAVVALHRYLARTPAVLLSIALTDAVGDRRVQNQPGTHTEYPNWRLPLCDAAGRPVLLEDLPGCALLRRVVATVTGPPI